MNPHVSFIKWILLLASMMLLACGKTDKTDFSTDTFIFARGSDAMKLDPADVDDGESINTLAQVMEGLVRFKSGTLEVEPALATSWEISEDGLTYTFHIRENVIFHDGVPLTAETALFSFERQINPEHPAHFPDASFQYWDILYNDIDSVKATDPMTLQIRLSQNNASILYSLASFSTWLISPGAFEKYGTGMQHHPVGTGPYRFVDWKPNQAIILEKNPNYWGQPAGFERMVIRPIPDNTVRLLELKSGKIHGLDGLSPNEIKELSEEPEFTIYHSPGMNVGYLAFSGFASQFESVEVRQAIAMAIDRQVIVELCLQGFGKVAEYPMPPGFLGEPKSSPPPISYNPRKAEKILAAHPEILAQTLTLHTLNAPRPYFPDPVMIASLIRNDLEKVGLKVDIVTKDFKSHLHDTRNGNFQMALLGWSGDNGDTDNFLATFFASWAAVRGEATNISFYKNETMDNLLVAGRSETNTLKRQLIYEQVLNLWAKDMPLVPLVNNEQVIVLNAHVTGFELSPTETLFLGPVGWKQ